MLSLSDLTHQDEHTQMFKPWWETAKNCITFAMLLITLMASGVKITSEQIICLPVVESNDSCIYNSDLCEKVVEISSNKFVEYISMYCSNSMDWKLQYSTTIGIIMPFAIYSCGHLFYTMPWIFCRLSALSKIIKYCNEMDIKSLISMVQLYKEIEKEDSSVGGNIENKSIADNSVIQEVSKLKALIEHAMQIRRSYEHLEDQVPMTRKEYSEVAIDNSPPIPPTRHTFILYYGVYSVLQIIIGSSYLVFLICLLADLKEETSCDSKEKSMYNKYRCIQSLTLSKDVSILLCILTGFLISLIILIYVLLDREWYYKNKLSRYTERKNLKLKGDFSVLMIFAMSYKSMYLDTFLQCLTESFQQEVNTYIADCKYPVNVLQSKLERSDGRLVFKRYLQSLPSSIFENVALQSIVSLEVADSDLSTYQTWDGVSNLSKLEQLVLVRCNLTQVPRLRNSNAGSSSSVMFLDVSYNDIKEVDFRLIPDTVVTFNILKNINLIHIDTEHPKALKHIYLDEEKLSIWNERNNVYVSHHVIVSNKKPRNHQRIRESVTQGRLYPTSVKTKGSAIIISNEIEVDEQISGSNIEDVKTFKGVKETGRKGIRDAVKTFSLLYGIFRFLGFDVKMFGRSTKEEERRAHARNLRESDAVVVVSISKNQNNSQIIKVIEDLHKNNTLYNKPKIVFSVNEEVGKEEQLIVEALHNLKDCFFAEVEKTVFNDTFIKFLQENNHSCISEIDFPSKSFICNKMTPRQYHFLPGYPWEDSPFQWIRKVC